MMRRVTDAVVKVWAAGGMPLAVVVVALTLLVLSVNESGTERMIELVGALVLLVLAMMLHVEQRAYAEQKADHLRCVEEVSELRRTVESQGRHLARFRQALMVYLVSSETQADKEALLDAIGEGL